ncbi:type I glyceraldehyde-3-phosphate dehydrogenase [Helicobacter sp. MIT 14-3879]|uniref:type I glyceraldehyde-3-phosphate dehydrogenase n=1 Tax=Helicobacter sp. MIT 14-3879 TaxID=2040649 RepID=UPI000E1E2DA4|nr:glyceraldehyde 3-phosphate dehydrogenase NAD-binding domain-containing protein [Helicobacter sp. MIT 14-3879]RDU64743.1 type I glyceraldehyde-3-phosphate dehydrogenase [Helicobacter sp. MIT 14-3879]
MTEIAINGFGRIGRALFRIANKHNDISIKYINDIKSFDKLSYLLKNDSVFGKFEGEVNLYDNKLIVDNKEILINQTIKDVDIVVECSGTKLDSKELQSYINNGAKKVILGAPPKDNMPIFVFGVNEEQYNNEKIISSASCSSNAIAPLIKALSDKFKILGGNITTIHPFNSDQVLLDNPHEQNYRLSRNATQNIIPTSSSIGNMLYKLFGKKIGIFYGDSIRIPTSIVSFSNIDILFENEIKKEDILELNLNKNIFGFDNDMLVSSDFIGDSRSAIIPTDLIKINDNLCRISLWFDNESGYANRLIDTIRLISTKN